MGLTKKRKYDRYTLAYKLQAVRLANHPEVKSKDVAESLQIHPVMLYRWQMEFRNGTLVENKQMKPSKSSPKRRKRADPNQNTEDELARALRRIEKLEKQLAQRDDEIDLLKKAERFLAKRRQQSSN